MGCHWEGGDAPRGDRGRFGAYFGRFDRTSAAAEPFLGASAKGQTLPQNLCPPCLPSVRRAKPAIARTKGRQAGVSPHLSRPPYGGHSSLADPSQNPFHLRRFPLLLGMLAVRLIAPCGVGYGIGGIHRPPHEGGNRDLLPSCRFL